MPSNGLASKQEQYIESISMLMNVYMHRIALSRFAPAYVIPAYTYRLGLFPLYMVRLGARTKRRLLFVCIRGQLILPS